MTQHGDGFIHIYKLIIWNFAGAVDVDDANVLESGHEPFFFIVIERHQLLVFTDVRLTHTEERRKAVEEKLKKEEDKY